MATRVYGESDDLVEFDGDFTGETGFYGSDDDAHGTLIVMSDGTLIEAKYGKNDGAIWEIKLVKKGELFERIDQCDNEDADPHSDVAHFKSGIKWAYAAKEWEKVR